MLDGLEEEPWFVADELEVGRHRRLDVGEHLGPHRDDAVGRGKRSERGAIGLDAHQMYRPVDASMREAAAATRNCTAWKSRMRRPV